MRTEKRPNWEYLPFLIQGSGIAFFSIFIVSFFLFHGIKIRMLLSDNFVFSLITNLPFLLVIGYAGYWLDKSELTVERYPRIGKWFAGGIAGFLGINAIMIAVWPTGATYNDIMWGLFAATVGGAGGITMGLFEARAIERAIAAERQAMERTRIEERNDRLEAFAGIVSHDLRNPLNVASGHLALEREKNDSEHLDSIADAHDRMETLIEDLLRLARSGQDIENVEQIRLPEILKMSWENVATANATIETDVDQTIRADRNRLRQVLENLIRNSVEHGGENVTVTVGRLDDGFYFEDDGPGIPPDDRERAFDAGYSTSEGGTGFGLSIVKQIVEAHEWTIEITDGTDGGVRFEITNVRFVDE
ncbi:ATP-binding protein [Halorubrum sp. Boch-26]|uniref:sensor histidine kinase n=1 Tax=Halorubrum sp. Boch-26 TaxID=2994426 RepID=UPI002468B6C5|nr:ATP-binding protein [Halorubrum sp. Boch-26]